ncbi:MAG: RNA methyltransferase [Bacteroidales bacterium]|nr:RNA methyltransferase [Bacteroidales bacterium]
MDVEFISSNQNPKIKLIHELYESKGRKKHKLFIAEGNREIYIALQSGYIPRSIFISQDYAPKASYNLFNDFNIPLSIVFKVEQKLFAKISYRENTEAIIALFEWKKHDLNQFKLSDNPLFIVVESVEKPGNLGAILRTADAAHVNGVIVCNPVIDLYNPNVVRSSIGCLFSVPIALASTSETITWLKQKNIKIYAAALQNAKFYHHYDYGGPTALVFGTEADGLSSEWINQADHIVKIPMLGMIDSLNVSNAVAIMTFEAMRQRNFKI